MQPGVQAKLLGVTVDFFLFRCLYPVISLSLTHFSLCLLLPHLSRHSVPPTLFSDGNSPVPLSALAVQSVLPAAARGTVSIRPWDSPASPCGSTEGQLDLVPLASSASDPHCPPRRPHCPVPAARWPRPSSGCLCLVALPCLRCSSCAPPEGAVSACSERPSLTFRSLPDPLQPPIPFSSPLGTTLHSYFICLLPWKSTKAGILSGLVTAASWPKTAPGP